MWLNLYLSWCADDFCGIKVDFICHWYQIRVLGITKSQSAFTCLYTQQWKLQKNVWNWLKLIRHVKVNNKDTRMSSMTSFQWNASKEFIFQVWLNLDLSWCAGFSDVMADFICHWHQIRVLLLAISQLAFTCSQSTMETPKNV